MVTAFVPCRAGSERVKFKNTREFAGRSGGLIEIKVDQLCSCNLIDNIVVSTNDNVVIDIVNNLFGDNEKVSIIRRPDELCLSSTSTDDVVKYVPSIIKDGPVLWTHVTSPFVMGYHYEDLIRQYARDIESGEFDSLMTVTDVRTFVWNDRGPINYERSVEKWPRTQTIKPLYEVNSAAFITDVSLMARLDDRIGRRPRLVSLDKRVAFDVDWPDDFDVAEMMWRSMHDRADFEAAKTQS
ncbi:cytidylyltransferase domain-containing protein [Mycoplana rhizolycopersici]|uniref:Acylneuraminate cytidylyltransferase family protein n=1 Tax=Mycoplana rhizolycopersici TaxID=2746702 RepID=A0ABX2QDV9_9HYPH|nr:acylneuraminate cytidylyltransferase family protein [Rhizobium rhizolycopersici]NVP54858.1 acylneuraminate cytidylyltransferase family protein [Rhizobium rhizolycopersici]